MPPRKKLPPPTVAEVVEPEKVKKPKKKVAKPHSRGRDSTVGTEGNEGTTGYHAKRGEARRDGATDVKVPKDKPGNTKGDQAWLEDQMNLGLIEDIGDDEDGIPFGAMKRWSGKQADIGSYWVLPPPERRCVGRARIRDGEGRMILDDEDEILMRPCARWAIQGGKVCVAHGGGVAHVQQAARLRLIAAADPLIGALISIAMDETQDAKARVAAINSALDRAGITGKIEVAVDTPQWQEMLSGMFDQEWKKE